MQSMNTGPSAGNESALWMQDLVNGLAGMTYKVKHCVHCEASPFQKIEVFETYTFGRILMLAGAVVLTEHDEYIYNEMIAHPALLMHPRPAHVCVIGGGDGGATREVLKHPTVESVTIVEIDELVVHTTRNHFPALATAFDDERTHLVIEDGRRYLEKTQEQFDIIIVDSYDPGGPVQSIISEPFFPLVSDRLGEGGIAVFQSDSPLLRAEHIRHTLRSVSPLFGQFKPYLCAMPSFPEGLCSFVVASKPSGGLETFAQERYLTIAEACRYYNQEVHAGAFLLPRGVRDIVSA
jgi:spermidine synthase